MAKEFTIDEIGGNPKAAVLRVTGRLDAKNAQVLFRKCRDFLEAKQVRVILNLADVSFVASSGVGTLLALTEEFKDAGGAIHLVSPSNAVKSVIDLLNLTQFLTIGDSEAEVLQAIGA